jgi:hypothetical protein
MANPTTNFGWVMPSATDLVTDLPADFDVFGQAVDTDLVGLKGGTTGQVLAKASGTDLDFVWSADAAGMTNPMTTTADIIYSSSGSTPARLGIGSAADVLTVDGSGVPTWAAPAGGGTSWSLLNAGGTAMSGVSSVTVSGISADKIFVFMTLAENTTGGAVQYRLILNNNTTAGQYFNNYTKFTALSTYSLGQYSYDSATGGSNIPFSRSATSGSQCGGSALILGAASSGLKSVEWDSGAMYSGQASATYNAGLCMYQGAAAITSVKVDTSGAGNFTNGTLYVYTSA